MEPTPPSLLWNDSILCFWSCSAMIRDGSANCTGPLAEKSDRYDAKNALTADLSKGRAV
jgi:hypothetical protein